MPHSCGKSSRFREARRTIAARLSPAAMQDRQIPIAEWMKSVLDRRGISARAWATLAGLGKDTVSRAIRDDYQHVTSTTTIAKLADAIDEQAPGIAGAIPSAAALVPILGELRKALPAASDGDDEVLLALAGALRDTLLHLADEPQLADDPKVSSALVRASVRQLRSQHA